MKYIKSYKIFEDNDEDGKDNEIPEGFEYSWNDIKKSLVYLTDLGFEIDKPEKYQWDYENEAKRRYLADEDGDKIKHTSAGWGREYKSNIELAKWAIYELRLKKPVTINGIYREGDNPVAYSAKNKFFLTENPEKMIEIYQEIDAFCAHFDKSYYSLLKKPEGYYLWLIVASAVSDDFINKSLDEELNSKVISKIEKHIHSTLAESFTSKYRYTKKFRDSFVGSTLYELKNGIAIKCFNWNSITKNVYNTNSAKFDSDVESILNDFNTRDGYFGYKRYGYKAEFRELKPEDIVGLKEGWEIERAKKYIGTKAIIVKFDYKKVFDKVKKELLAKKD